MDLQTLTAAVQACTLCSRMAYSHILGAANGPGAARVMFVGEAPGRLGAGRTGVPFHGDESGRRFEALLAAASLTRADVFVTNAVLCNPVDLQHRNRRPLTSEVKRCLPFLRGQIEAVDPRLVVALGGVGLGALSLIESHEATLRADCGRALPWFGRTLVPLYHTGRRTLVHRREADQIEDWRRLGELLATLPAQGAVTSNDMPMPLSGAIGVRQAMK